MQRALDDFLAGAEGEYWAQEGWEVLTESESQVTPLNLADSGALFMSFEGSGDGWIWTGASSCDGLVSTALPAGLSQVDWVLDPAAPAPDPASTQIAVLATERDCNSGHPMGERLLAPHVVETVDAVLVTFTAVERTGNADCPGNPATAVTVTLPSPLGDRELRDGLYVGPLSELASP